MTTLYPFQEQAVTRMVEGNLILADKCGMGKTYSAAAYVTQYAQGPVLIVTPKPAKEWWRHVLVEEFNVPMARVRVLGPAGAGMPKTVTGFGVVITHPESLLSCGQQVASIKWDTVIVDEAHRFKNRQAKRTAWLFKVKARRRICLTATPYGRNPGDLWALMHWLAPDRFTSYWSWYNQYVDFVRLNDRAYDIIKGGKNLEQLAQVVAPWWLGRDYGEVELPSLVEADMPVQLNDAQVNLYLRLVKDKWAIEGSREVVIRSALALLTRLHQLSIDPSLIGVSQAPTPAKYEWLDAWLEDNPDEPVVVASRYRDVALGLANKYRWPAVVGGLSEDDLHERLRGFNVGGRMTGTIQAIAETLNLQRASTLIILDGLYSPTLMYQLSKRIHRIGQTRPCQVTWLLGRLSEQKGTVDYLVRRAVKQRLTEAQMLQEFIEEVK